MNESTLPSTWKTVRLKYLGKVNMGQSPDSSLVIELNHDETFPFLQGNAEFGEIYPHPTNGCHSPRKVAAKGELLLSVRAPVGALNIADRDYGIGRGLCSIQWLKVNPQYGWWLMHYYRSHLSSIATGSTYDAVSAEDVANLSVSIPKDSSQIEISNYLDNETRRIDELISEKERMLNLLAKKRILFISSIVTKGLKPDVPLIASGYSWIGDIPKHWDMIRIKFLGDIFYGLSQPPTYHRVGTPFVRATNIDKGMIKTKGLVFIHENEISKERAIHLQKGDIIVVRSGAYTGDSAMVTKKWTNSIAGYDMVLRVRNYAIPEFVSILLRSRYVLEQQIIPLRLRAAQPHLNAEELGNVILALPPLEEQKQIIQKISEYEIHLNHIIVNVELSISLLKERRSVLINTAVTKGLINS